jgi:hypothetical protein
VSFDHDQDVMPANRISVIDGIPENNKEESEEEESNSHSHHSNL